MLNRRQKKWRVAWVVCLLLAFVVQFAAVATEDAQENVLVLRIEDEIEGGLHAYLARHFENAQSDGIDLIVLEMDTPGGQVAAAEDIKKLIYDCPIEVVCYITNQGISAGAYLALASDVIAMRPGSTIGDAELRIGTEKAEEKYLSVWREEFAAMAEVKGRDAQIARAMVDSDIAIEGLIEKGKLLVLSADQAHELGFCDYIAEDMSSLLELLGFEDAKISYGEMTTGDYIARFLTNSTVAPILLGLGIICIVFEVLSAGSGFLWIPGVICLGLYFGGHMMAGLISWVSLLLFLTGIVLCLIEVFIPSFGILGAGGLVAIIASIFLMTPDVGTAIRYLIIILVMMLLAVPVLLKLIQKGKVLDKVMVKKELRTEDGYISRNPELGQYLGQTGTAFTVLRPGGTMQTENGMRLDVITRGEFIEQGARVCVVGMDGTWLIVEKCKEENQE